MKRLFTRKAFTAAALLAVAGLAAGCDLALDIEIPLPPHESRLVVNALFETDTTIAVHLGRSREVGQRGNAGVQNGRVALYMDGQFVEHLRATGNGDFSGNPDLYASEHIMQPDRMYRLEAEASGLEPVTAEERTMPLPTFEVVSVTSGAAVDSWYREDRVVIRIFDDPGRNFYHLSFPTYMEHEDLPGDGHFVNSPFRSDDPVLQDGRFFDLFDAGARRYASTIMFSDAAFDGRAYTIAIDVLRPRDDHGGTAVPFIRLDAVSERYYRYVRARQALEDSDGNPFAEPVFLPSNVTNGLGIFAGRSGRRVPLEP